MRVSLLVKVVAALAFVSASFGAAVAAEVTIEKGYVSKTPPTKGIVLHLHGCDGLYTEGWVEPWIRHFEYSGYRVIAPDSFAEARPDMSCGDPWPNKWEIYNIRVAQTKRAIAEIRASYPDKPLYIWGHSEGAWLAARVDDETDGVVTTGATCGFNGGSKIYFPQSVPYLALIGDPALDHYLRDEFSAKGKDSVAGTCESTDASPNWTWKSFEGVGHIMPIWDRRVREAISQVIDISVDYSGIRGDAPDDPPRDWNLEEPAKTAIVEKYRDSPNEKAFAIGPDGSYGYSTGWHNGADAKADALAWCNKFSNVPCAVYAVNDEVVLPGAPPLGDHEITRPVEADHSEGISGVSGPKSPASEE